jgi:PPK2 family polyphosphate:nucleotide phosphotransferase
MIDEHANWSAELIEPLRVRPGSTVDLPADFDPRYRPVSLRKSDAKPLLRQGVELLADYQARLAAQDVHGLLVILQALDGAGKDSTIRHVMSGVNPQGVHVHAFKAPSVEELDHDYLWRVASRLPRRGEITIFNRSHYEEVLVVRVHPELLDGQRLPDEARGADLWSKRYRQINEWERHLTENGFRVLKLFLNVSKEEQRERFLRRLDVPEKNWKFSARDVEERTHWEEYQAAYSDMLSNTSTEWAPWHVIPADRKWLARICVASVIVHALMEIDPRYPTPDDKTKKELDAARASLVAESEDRTTVPETVEASSPPASST